MKEEGRDAAPGAAKIAAEQAKEMSIAVVMPQARRSTWPSATVCQRVLEKNSSTLKKDRFAKADFIVSRNEICTCLNNLRIKNFARSSKQRILVSVSKDNITVEGEIATSTRKANRRKPYKGCGRMPGYLPLLKDMTCFLTENFQPSNIGVELGMVNMAKATIIKVVLDEKEGDIDMDYRLPPYFLKYPPVMVLVQLHDTSLGDITGYGPGVVPIFQKSATFEFRKNFKVKRYQIPLVPGYSYTSYSCQVHTQHQVR
jgi:hypothetical protein